MPAYRYLFADLMTGNMLAELPLTQVNFQCKLNDAGDLNAMLNTGDPKLNELDWVDATQESRTAVWVDRDGVLVWGGILWKVEPNTLSGSSQGVRLKASETWSYFKRRFLLIDKSWTNADQCQIVADLINYAQSASGGNIGVVVPAVVNSGITRTLALTADQLVNIAQEVMDLAAMYQGFDFSIDWQYSGTPPTPVATLNVSYPRRGRAAASSNLMFDLPGNIVDYDCPRDGSMRTDSIIAVGAGSGPSMLRSFASSSTLIAGGYPLLEAVTSYKDVIDQSILDGHATSDLNLLSQPSELYVINVRAGADPMLGSYITGDEGRFMMTNEDFPLPITGGTVGLDENFRITGYTVYPTDSSQNQHEVVSLQLGPVWSP